MLIAIAGLIGIAEFLWLDRLSRRSALGRYAGSLLNPLLLLLAFHVLIMADFIQLYTYGYSALGLTIFRFYRGEVAYAALVYVFLFGWLELGIQLGLRSSQKHGHGKCRPLGNQFAHIDSKCGELGAIRSNMRYVGEHPRAADG